MTAYNPVYTERAECQDCYKCVRECIAKAIKVSEGHAQVLPERCVLCGHCVSVCPVGAKRVRSDLMRAQSLILNRPRVYASLAPSFVGAYPDVSPHAMVAALGKLGFAGVSETAIGAELISRELAADLRDGARPLISSACPAVVDLIEKYYPAHRSLLSDTLSPLQAHGQFLREQYGEDIAVVFIGPCVAKKKEADERPDLIDAALTFEELDEWFHRAGIEPDLVEQGSAFFVPRRADDGALYPLEGGMIATLSNRAIARDRTFLSVSGLESVQEVLDELAAAPPEQPLFLELLACRGGCINGPMCSRDRQSLRRRSRVLSWLKTTKSREELPAVAGTLRTTRNASESVGASGITVAHPEPEPTAITAALRKIGKHSAEDELNCGGCGYETCRDFACAMLDGRAERTMCAGYMRELAQQKANALLRAMPSGVVMVTQDLRILECNEKFVQLLGEEAQLLYDASPGLEGVDLSRIVPFWSYFKEALSGNLESVTEDFQCDGRVLNGTVFVIQAGQLAGGIFQDVTAPAVQRERIITQAQEVITRNLSTVQQIASLMGENAAETESMLNSIIDAFGSPK